MFSAAGCSSGRVCATRSATRSRSGHRRRRPGYHFEPHLDPPRALLTGCSTSSGPKTATITDEVVAIESSHSRGAPRRVVSVTGRRDVRAREGRSSAAQLDARVCESTWLARRRHPCRCTAADAGALRLSVLHRGGIVLIRRSRRAWKARPTLHADSSELMPTTWPSPEAWALRPIRWPSNRTARDAVARPAAARCRGRATASDP